MGWLDDLERYYTTVEQNHNQGVSLYDAIRLANRSAKDRQDIMQALREDTSKVRVYHSYYDNREYARGTIPDEPKYGACIKRALSFSSANDFLADSARSIHVPYEIHTRDVGAMIMVKQVEYPDLLERLEHHRDVGAPITKIPVGKQKPVLGKNAPTYDAKPPKQK